jgi:hypothetical protein
VGIEFEPKRGGTLNGNTLLTPNNSFFDEFLMSRVVQQEALTRLLVEKGIFSKEEFLEMVKVVNLEMAEMV